MVMRSSSLSSQAGGSRRVKSFSSSEEIASDIGWVGRFEGPVSKKKSCERNCQ